MICWRLTRSNVSLLPCRKVNSKRILLSSPWAYFNYRTNRARFVPTSLWHDLVACGVAGKEDE